MIQQPAPEQTPVDASALRIEYIRSKDLVRLLDDARIAQNGSTLSGDQIDYLVSQRSVRAAGTTGSDGQGRVEVVIRLKTSGPAPLMRSTLVAQHLAKAYGGRPVVKDVSLEVSEGEIVGLLGPNGAGKTTCFYMIVGLVDADAGDIQLDNQSLMRLPMHRRARAGIGYLPQEASVFRQLTVKDNLLAILETRSELTRKARDSIAQALLEEFSVSHLADSLGQALSGGERRRVEIARALATEPRVILLDEPFAGVDPISISDIKSIITHLKERNIGVLITDHNVRETLDICERAYIVGEGHVIASGTPTEVLANDRVRNTYLGEHFSL